MNNQTLEIDICIVAYNEQERIIESLVHVNDAIAATQHNVQVYIVTNGCKDFTVAQCEYYCRFNPRFSLHDITLGDKANAWNYYVHSLKNNNNLTLFIDGDCFISKNSIEDIASIYLSQPNVNCISGYPATVGRQNIEIKRRMLEQGDFPGNLYALTPKMFTQIKAKNFYLPVGLIGDDSLLIWVCGNDLSMQNERKRENYTTAISALYHYERLVPNSLKNIKQYFRRLDRYSLRRYQQMCIRTYVNKYDFDSLPPTMEELYVYREQITLKTVRLELFNLYFDFKHYLAINKR